MLWIDPYYRFDRWEYVSGHWRRLPTDPDQLPWASSESRMPTALPSTNSPPAETSARRMALRVAAMGTCRLFSKSRTVLGETLAVSARSARDQLSHPRARSCCLQQRDRAAGAGHPRCLSRLTNQQRS